MKLTYKQGLKDGIPIAAGYFAVSFAFGVSVVSQGLPWFVATVMSLTNLTSAGQFAGASVIIALGTVFEILLTQVVINARYFLMSITLSQRLDEKVTLLDRFLISYGITDEIFGVAVSKKEPVTKEYMYGLILLPVIFWTLGTLTGGLAGNFLPEIVLNSLSIALYAMFIAIVVPAGMGNKKVFVVVAIAIGLSCLFYFTPVLNTVSSGIAYIISALVASVIGAIFFPIKEESTTQDHSQEEQNG
ncbi:MAG: AzlC family ABC transporter permease [Clostridia bacterium]|nr:AzlC family ABC transporter permease [Clostridia bacterium]